MFHHQNSTKKSKTLFQCHVPTAEQQELYHHELHRAMKMKEQ